MKKTLIITLSLLLTLTIAHTSFARDIAIMNSTNSSFSHLSVSDTNSDNITNFLLEPLQPEDGIVINITEDSGWDIIAESTEGNALLFEDIDFTGANTVYLLSDGSLEMYSESFQSLN